MAAGLRLQFPSHPDMSEAVNQRRERERSHLRTGFRNLHPAACDYVFFLSSNYFHIRLYSPLHRHVAASCINK